jgi:hypothetical protein
MNGHGMRTVKTDSTTPASNKMVPMRFAFRRTLESLKKYSRMKALNRKIDCGW